MLRRANRHALATAVGLLIAGPTFVEACSCGEVPPAAAFATADAVFLARIDGATAWIDPGSRLLPGRSVPCYRLRVLAAWKGVTSDHVLVVTGRGGGDCGVEFGSGEVFLVYATRSGRGDTLSANICSRTRAAEYAGEDWLALGPPALDRTGGMVTRSFTTSFECPRHPGQRLLWRPSYLVVDLPMRELRAWQGAVHDDLPYAALRFATAQEVQRRQPNPALTPARVCPACREAALAWCHAHGLPCHAEADVSVRARQDPDSSAAAGAMPDSTYRRLHPRASFSFQYNDSRRMYVTAPHGRVTRLFVSIVDTTVAIDLPDTTIDAIYERAIAARAWDLPTPHPPYAAPGARDPETPCVRTSLRLTAHPADDRRWTPRGAFDWDPGAVTGSAGEDAAWSALRGICATIESAVRRSHEWRALP